MISDVASSEIDPLDDPRWEDLNTRGGTLFSSSPWLRAVADTYGLKPRAKVVQDASGELVAGLAYCRIDDMLGPRLISFPFSDFQEPVGDPGRAGPAIQALIDEATDGAPIRLRIPDDRLPELATELFPHQDRELLHHRIAVSETDPDKQFAALNGQVRQNIRRSRRDGLHVEMRSDLDAVRMFYDLHVGVRTMKYRLLPQPFRFFESLHAVFAPHDRLRVALATFDGRAVAGIFYIEWGDTLYYKFNASAADGLSVRPNEALIWAGMEHCLQRGLSKIDLGVSDTDQPGLVRYKRKFAGFEQEVVTLKTAPPAASPHSGELRTLFGNLTDLFTDPGVPSAVAEAAGDVLYRYFA